MAQKPLNDDALEIEEYDQANNLVATYIKSPSTDSGSRIDVIVPKNSNSYARSILNAFLPAGYPNSVTSDYLEYQIYDSLQAFSSSIAGMLSSRAVLEGIGVGDSHASPTAALLLTVLQESMGRIATILFAHRLGTSLEPECKMYRLAADIFNDAAMLLDCLSPAFPKASRVALLSLSSVLRSLCGVAAGSSKASLSAHFATQGNLGELNAKDSSQETIISLMGMLAGSLVVSYISSKWATWTAMIFLLTIHLGTNYLAVRAVCMQTLNRQRANLVFSSLLEQLRMSKASHIDDRALSKEDLPQFICPTPEGVRLQEKVFERDGVLRWKGEILGYCRLGVDLKTVLNCFSQSDSVTGSHSGSQLLKFSRFLKIFNKKCGYIVWYDQPKKTFLVVLEEGASPVTILKAWMFALQFAKYGKVRDGVSLMETLLYWRVYLGQFEDEMIRSVGKKWDLQISAMETQPGTRIRMKNSKRS